MKKIASKTRSDYLINPEDGEIEEASERPSGKLDFSDGEYENRKIVWERSGVVEENDKNDGLDKVPKVSSGRRSTDDK